MNGDIVKGPVAFCTYADFFARVKDKGEGNPVRIEDKRKPEFVMRLKAINPHVSPHYGIEEDLIDSARIREARVFDDGGMYVRYEVSCRMCDGDWDGPYQLLVLWNKDASLAAYTFIHGTGRRANVAASLYTARDDRSVFTEDVDQAIAFALAMTEGDSIIVGNDDCNGEFLCITSRGGAAEIAWQVFGSPYWFNAVKTIPWDEAVAAVRVFREQGVRGAQALCEWEIADAYDENTGMMTFHVPLILRRFLSRAISQGDKARADRIRACGISLKGRLPFVDVTCPYGDEKKVQEFLQKKVVSLYHTRQPMIGKMLMVMLESLKQQV